MTVRSRFKIVVINLLAIVILSCYFINSLSAQESRKTEIYYEFFEVTGAKQQYEQIQNTMLHQLQKAFGDVLKQLVKKDKRISETRKKEILPIIDEIMADYFEKLRVEVFNILPFREVAQNVYIPVYRKYFSDDEIRDLLKFFKTPAGRKFVRLAPKLLQETVTIVNKKYGPRLRKASNRIAKEEFAILKERIGELK